MIKRDPDAGTICIHCDGCDKPAPPPEEMMKAHGLARMGWYCSGGTHLCPDHEHPEQGWPNKPEPMVLPAGGRGTVG